MAFVAFVGVDEAVELLAIFVTALSGYYMYRQGTTSFTDARNLIVAVHVLFGAVVASEFFGTLAATQAALEFYVIAGTCLILLCVQLLTMLAWSVYLPIQKPGLGNLLKGIYSNRLHLSAFTLGTLYIAFVGAYLVVGAPYYYVSSPFPSFNFDLPFLLLLFGVLILFMCYTSTIFTAARRKTPLQNVKRALVLLPLAWIGIGVDLLVFNSFSSSSLPSVDISPFGYLIAALGLGATSTIFRRASLLAGFFESRRKQQQQQQLGVTISTASASQSSTGNAAAKPATNAAAPFSKDLGLEEGAFLGRKYLMEVDSSASYERRVNDFANELAERDCSVFVFTARGSPIYKALSRGQSRFYLLSATVSYTTVSDVPTEVLVPQNDPAIIVDALQKTLETDPVSPMGIVFDSVSDFVLTLGLETTYKLLKKILEAIDSERITGLFLMTAEAHDERETSLIKSLFANQLALGTAEGFAARRIA